MAGNKAWRRIWAIANRRSADLRPILLINGQVVRYVTVIFHPIREDVPFAMDNEGRLKAMTQIAAVDIRLTCYAGGGRKVERQYRATRNAAGHYMYATVRRTGRMVVNYPAAELVEADLRAA